MEQQKNNESSVKSSLYYINDPMCSWCYAFRNVWHEVLMRLPELINIKYILGGLAPDNDEPMPVDTQDYIRLQWQKITDTVPDSYFNFDFWKNCTPRRSTYIACRAVILAREQNLESEMIHAIQNAYYKNAENPSDAITLIALAINIGMDKKAFTDNLNANSTKSELLADIAFARSIGGNSFPSLFLEHHHKVFQIQHNYHNADLILTDIMRIITSSKK